MKIDTHTKLKKAREEFTDPEDQERFDDMEKTIEKQEARKKFILLEETQELICFLQDRIKELNLSLIQRVGMDREENKAVHAKISECKLFLNRISDDPEALISQVEDEIKQLLTDEL